MERASRALVRTDYFQAERLAQRGLELAWSRLDYERMARSLLPLQEARRQKRQLACDSGERATIADPASAEAAAMIGRPMCVLVQPPMVGAEVRAIRHAFDERRVPALVLCREPLTRDGRWPIVAVGGAASPAAPAGGPVVIRVRLTPPENTRRVEGSATRDNSAPGPAGPSVRWFQSAAEALGDAAIARLEPSDPPAWHVADLMEFLDAHPDHEKLHQRLADACRAALSAPEPTVLRRRAVVRDPFSF